MSEEQSNEPDLRPIVARLQEIQRKCLSLGSRNDEAEETATRLGEIVDELEREREDGDTPPYAKLAKQLFPVARLFESLGFMSVARELAHVENALRELDPSPPEEEPDQVETAARSFVAASAEVGVESSVFAEPESEERHGLPKPVALALLSLLLVVLVSIVTLRLQNARDPGREGPLGRPTAAPVRTTDPPQLTPEVNRDPAPTDPGTEPTPHPRAQLAQLIGEARLARQQGDLDSSISLLSRAALISKTDTDVLDTARLLVNDLVGQSDGAAANAEWQAAKRLLDRAREIAIRFELSLHPIEDAARRHASMVRYQPLRPHELEAIRAAAGRSVVVLTLGGNRHQGRIHGVTGEVLELDVSIDVGGGGKIYHVDEIPLVQIREIRVFPD